MRAAVFSVALHGGLAALVLVMPRVGRDAARTHAVAIEMELQALAPRRALAEAPSPRPSPPSGASGHEGAARPAVARRAHVATAPHVSSPAIEPAPAIEPSPSVEPSEPAPARPLALFDRAALTAAVEATAPHGTAGVTTRGEVDEGDGGAAAVDGVRALTDEMRERVQAGRPEAAGVVTYFHDQRRRMASAWAPRTLHLPSRTKAMIQSMQAMNRAALEMMEGRSERARQAQEDGRITPNEWRDAMRDAAQRARATTSVIVAIVYDEAGRVTDVRITRSSGHEEFDREVLEAARETLGHEPAPPMPDDPVAHAPGGRVARYRFDVLMSAMPPVPPIAGITFDESTGYFRVFYPGEINWRLNVVFLGARRGMDLRPQSRESD